MPGNKIDGGKGDRVLDIKNAINDKRKWGRA